MLSILYLFYIKEKEVKKAADKTLSEVRKKLADANKSLELIKAVTKLRAARKDSMQSKGKKIHEQDNLNTLGLRM